MKKQIKPASSAGRKLSLNKKTISNLIAAEMSNKIGGTTGTTSFYYCLPGKTHNGNTCHFHKTCYTC